jgi:hypothetical protein
MTISHNCDPHIKYYNGDRIKEDEVGWSCSAQGIENKPIRSFRTETSSNAPV